MKEIWNSDRGCELEQYENDQHKNSKIATLNDVLIYDCIDFIATGKKSNRWSVITIRIGKLTCTL